MLSRAVVMACRIAVAASPCLGTPRARITLWLRSGVLPATNPSTALTQSSSGNSDRKAVMVTALAR